MLDDPKYAHNLFCDISTMCAFLRLGDPLTTMLERQDLHNRLGINQDHYSPNLIYSVWYRLSTPGGLLSNPNKHALFEGIYHNPGSI